MNDGTLTGDAAAAGLARTLACCAKASWLPLLHQADQAEPCVEKAAEPLLIAIAAEARRLRALRLATHGPEDGAAERANDPLTLPRLAVDLAFQQLQLAEQFLLLGREQAAEQRAAAFLQGLQTAQQTLPDQGLSTSDPHAPSPLDAAQAPALVERLRQQLGLAERLRQGGLPEHLLLVLGMHRSGTSALAGLLCSHGYDAPRDPMPPDPNNPRGYWESMGLYALNDDLLRLLGSDWSDPAPLPPGWGVTPAATQWRSRLLDQLAVGFSGARCAVVKDPRFCVLIEGLLPWLESGLLETTLLLPVRHPLEVAHSLLVRDGLPLREGLRLWLAHVFAAERLSRGHTRCILPFEQVLEQPMQVVALVNRLVGRAAAEPEAAAAPAADPAGGEDFIDPSLRHQRRELLEEQRRGLADDGVAELPLAEDLHAALTGPVDPATDREGLTRLERLHRRWLSLRPDAPRRAAPGENDPAG
jgi:hypothetical protein